MRSKILEWLIGGNYAGSRLSHLEEDLVYCDCCGHYCSVDYLERNSEKGDICLTCGGDFKKMECSKYIKELKK